MREKNENERERDRKQDLYVGYCSLTAPLLNFKQEPWAEKGAEERAEQRKGRKDRAGCGSGVRERAAS